MVNGVPGTDGMANDTLGPGNFVKPYQANSFNSTQYYQYTCNRGSQVTLLGPLTKTRSVSKNSDGSFSYTITSRGKTLSFKLP